MTWKSVLIRSLRAALGLGVILGTGAAAAGSARVAGVEVTRGRIGVAQSPSGAQVRLCLSPQVCESAQNAAKVTVHIGPFDETSSRQNGANTRLWVLYE